MKKPIMDLDYEKLFDSIMEESPYFIEFENSFNADCFREKYQINFQIHQLDHFLFFRDKNDYLAAIILI